jgi:hypothetical protein
MNHNAAKKLAIDVHNNIARILEKFNDAHSATLDISNDDRPSVEAEVVGILEDVIEARSQLRSPEFFKFIEGSPSKDPIHFCTSLAHRLSNLHLALGEDIFFQEQDGISIKLDELGLYLSISDPTPADGMPDRWFRPDRATERACYHRDQLFLDWSSGEDRVGGPTSVARKWNDLDLEIRSRVCPDSPASVTRDAAKKGAERAGKERNS